MIYFVDNPKGGVGKSTISSLLIRALMDRGTPKVYEIETRQGSLLGMTGNALDIDVLIVPAEHEVTKDPSLLEQFYLAIMSKAGAAMKQGDVVVDFGAGTSKAFWAKDSIAYAIRKLGAQNITVIVPTTAAVDSITTAKEALEATKKAGITQRVLIWNERTTTDKVGRRPDGTPNVGELEAERVLVIGTEVTGLAQKAAAAGIPIEKIISSLDNESELEKRAVKLFSGEDPMLATMKAMEQFKRLREWFFATLQTLAVLVPSATVTQIGEAMKKAR